MFKYKVITIAASAEVVENRLNDWARLGWRLVGTTNTNEHGVQYIFEKEVSYVDPYRSK